MSLVAFLVGAGWLAAADAGRPAAGPLDLESPRLTALMKALDAGTPGVVDGFWREVTGRCPLVEPVPGDDGDRWVTFLWRGHAGTRRVDMLGEVPTANMAKWGMRRLRDTDVWFKTERVPKAARFGYKIRENGGNFGSDPLNPRTLLGRSVVELPDAPPQPWIRESPAAAKGKLVAATIDSRILGEVRTLGLYEPFESAARGRPAALVIVFDGEAYGNGPDVAVPTPVILDNLIAAGKMPPAHAVLVNSQKTRSRDLQCSAPFADFVAKELVPWVRRRYRVSGDPARTVVAGASLGGLAAAWTAFRHPRVFGKVLAQSGTFTYFPAPDWDARKDFSAPTGWLTRQLATAAKRPLAFYLEVGLFEGGPVYNLLRENRHLRDVLEARGYPVTYREFVGGHDYFTWRSSFGDGLIALLGNGVASDSQVEKR